MDAVAEEAIEIDDSNFRDFTGTGGALFWEVDIFNRLGYQQAPSARRRRRAPRSSTPSG
ncbi:MAG: hypothetical protein R3B51_13055 [Thermodesulfobacteriota bacterium]